MQGAEKILCQSIPFLIQFSAERLPDAFGLTVYSGSEIRSTYSPAHSTEPAAVECPKVSGRAGEKGREKRGMMYCTAVEKT